MTTAMQTAFYSAGMLPEHIMPIGNEFYFDHNGETVIVPEQEIAWVENRYVHACPLPTGYLEKKVGELRIRTMTSQVRFVGKAWMEEEGYTSATEFAQAMMREHLQETAHISAAVSAQAQVGDQLVNYGHLPPAIDKPRPEWLKEQPEPRKPRVFYPSEMAERPDELVNVRLFDRDIVGQMRALISLSDWDPALAYAQLKEWDALCAMYERLLFNTVEYGNKTKQEIQRLYREADAAGDEIPRLQVERLNERLQGLRVQAFNFSRKFKMARQERERAVAQSGLNFGPYMTLEQRASYGAQAHRAKKRSRVEIDLLNALPAEELARLHRHGLFGYKPRHDGVDSDGGNNPVSMGFDE